MAAASILARSSFHNMAHPADKDLTDGQRHYERRARELEVTAGDHAELREFVRLRMGGAGVSDDAIEPMVEATARGLAFLHSKVAPIRDIGTLGEDRRWPSEDEVESFAQYVKYFQDPAKVFEDLADQTLTPEGPELMREVMPELYNEGRAKLIEIVAERIDDIPYERLQYVALMVEVPLDATARPELGAQLAKIHAETALQQQQVQRRPASQRRINTNEQSKAQELGAK